MTKVAINGFGRIGRCAFKIIADTPDLEVAAINDLVSAENLAYLLRFDTVYGRYGGSVEAEDEALVVNGQRVPLLHEKDPAVLPWGDLGVRIVIECTGLFRTEEDLRKHLSAGAEVVILSAPVKGGGVETVVYGVNEADQRATMLSCASCTTNGVAPVAEVMNRRLGVKKAILTTVHGYTSTQGLVDGPNKHPRRGRAAACNLVLTSTGAAKATALTVPAYQDRFDGVAIRAPVPSGSIADIVFLTDRPTSVEEVNGIFAEEASSDRYRDVLGVSVDGLVSSDILGDPRASVVDLEMTRVVDGDLVKVMAWYDNEWGYASQMVKEVARIADSMPA